jgi:hypothetical protein
MMQAKCHSSRTSSSYLSNYNRAEMKWSYLITKPVATFRAGLGAEWWVGGGGFETRQELRIFLFTTASRPALGPTQPSIQWVQGALSLEVMRPAREANHSRPSSVEVKNVWGYTFTPHYAFMSWCWVKVQGQLYFTLLYFTLLYFT